MDWAEGARFVVERDPAFASIVDQTGPPELRPPLDGYFQALVRSITFQQLAGRAAMAIHGRFVDALGGSVTPEAVLELPIESFRAAGLSGSKTASIRDLAAKVVDGTVPVDGLDGVSDEEIIERLSSVRGIGRWTAEMFLMFQLRRPDVWPVEDFGVRKGYALLQRLAAQPKPRELAELGETYRPWRSVAAWYCWRAAETIVPAG